MDEEENEEQIEQTRLQGTYYDQIVIKASQNGNLEEVQSGYEKKPKTLIFEDKKKWTPIVWAANKNHMDIIKFLIEKNALEPYLKDDVSSHPNKCTLGVINQSVKPTPLQWACFKGHLQIVWMLLKNKCRWEDVDQFGNNCAHLAASGGNLKVFQALLMHGIDTEGRNSRNHTVLDLATNKEIIVLINIHMEAKNCADSGIPFNDNIKKHWCQTCRQIYSPECFTIKWTWETEKSETEERIDGKCNNCWENIAEHSNELKKLMDQYEYDPLSAKLEQICSEEIEIDLKLHDKANQLQEQLKTQNRILDFIKTLKKIDNYKTIFKSVYNLREMKQDAKDRSVSIDENVTSITESQISRLLSERKLRYDLDNMLIATCTPENQQELSDSIEDARTKGVAVNYLDEAEYVKDRMTKSLLAQEIIRLFSEYKTPPFEEYVPCFYRDKKTGKAMDPTTKKPADAKSFPPPKKKKKKKGQPTFEIPDWCLDGPELLEEKIKQLQGLLEYKDDCKFESDFLGKCDEEIHRMNRELKHRKDLVEQNLLVAEYKAAQKKAKK